MISGTTSPEESTPPPEESTPPPKESIPPPKESIPPPKGPLNALADEVTSSPCLHCNLCTKNPPGAKLPKSACSQWTHRALDKRNPPAYIWGKNPFRLYVILRDITPKPQWKAWLARFPSCLGGYRKETHYRPKLSDCPKPKETRLSRTPHPWHYVRQGLEPQLTLWTAPPRITTVAVHGPYALLRPFFPEPPKVPKATISAERAAEMVATQRSIRLAGAANCGLGGYIDRIEVLEALKAPEASSDMEETEPLRAMSLKQVTNIQLLKDYTAVSALDEEEKDNG